jgi:hypothetical protein
VRDAILEDLGVGAIFDRQRDERGACIVVPPVSPAERREVGFPPEEARVVDSPERFETSVRAAPLGRFRRKRHDQVIRGWRTAYHLGPPAELPFREHRGERGMYRDVLHRLGLGVLLSTRLAVIGARY